MENVGRDTIRFGTIRGRTNGRLWGVWLPLFFTTHLLYTAVVVGLRTEHLFFYGLVMGLCYGGDRSRRFLQVGFPLWLFGAAYDSMRLIPADWRPAVHVGDLYRLEQGWFGFTAGGRRVILPEFFAVHNTPLLDLLCGFLYLTYLLVFILFLFYLYRRNFEMAVILGWSFFILNMAGLVTFQLFPVAPPWYVARYGLGPVDPATAADPAGTLRFDALVGYPVCEAIYRKSPDVFGALPSLHVANPVLLFLFARRLGRGWVWAGFLYALGVAFSALYFSHHYVIDVLTGGLYAVSVYLVVPWAYEWWKVGRGGGRPRRGPGAVQVRPFLLR